MDAGVVVPETIKSIADLITSVAWPSVVVMAIAAFRPELKVAMSKVTGIKAFGFEATLKNELDAAAEDASKFGKLSAAPTSEELSRAAKIDEISSSKNIALIQEKVEDLAEMYERTRASMPPGDSRTRRLEVVVAKMRAIGLAAWRLRYDLIASSSPGKRLQAIASLQVLPDFDLLDWLAERTEAEKPFVAYHALVAMNVAAKSDRAKDNLNYLRHALSILDREGAKLGDGDRKSAVKDYRDQVALLSAAP